MKDKYEGKDKIVVRKKGILVKEFIRERNKSWNDLKFEID